MTQHTVQLLTRASCGVCRMVHERLSVLAAELGFELSSTDVDEAAAAGDTALRAEYGDLVPVVLLDGAQHSYWDLDEDRLREALTRR